MSNHSPKVRKGIAFILSLALGSFGAFNTSSISAAENAKAGNAKENSQQVGQLIVTGSVTVNEKRAITGTTVFTDSRIAVACAKGSSAIVNLGRLGRVELTAGSRLVLRFSDGLINGDLLEGKAVVSTPAGVKVAVNTPEGVSSADGKEATVTPVATQRGVRCVPIAMSSSGSASALGSGALAALLIGVGGAAVAGAAVASTENTSSLSGIVP
ncbi:MAG: hypothetical protein AB7U82_28555 [Blastocatellales bacterium]